MNTKALERMLQPALQCSDANLDHQQPNTGTVIKYA